MTRFSTAAYPRAFALMLLAALAMAFSFSATARADGAQAQAFVQQNVQRGLGILGNKSLSGDQRRAQFRSFLTSLTDIQRIANFTLGNARRSASPADEQVFDAAFKEYAIAVYDSRLSKFSGQALQVTGATERAPGDFVVTTTLIDPTDENSRRNPLEVDFRVQSGNGKMIVIDVAVAGVWLGIEERDQFAAFLNDHNGSIPALAAHLQKLSVDLRSGAQSTGDQSGQ